MIEAKDFVKELMKNNLGPLIEVPCSLLSPIINFILDKRIPLETPANEAIGMGLAAGRYLATGKIPVIMMQNSGLCNAMDALTSLFSIYEIPALLIVTWRGKPGTKDAPEHQIMGKKLENLLKLLDLPYRVVTVQGYKNEIEEMVKRARETKKPTVLVLRRGVIQEYERVEKKLDYPLTMHNAIRIIKEVMDEKVIYVSTTGFISRTSFNVKDSPDFYMLGSMGHALPIGLGVALETDKKVVILDGDGGCLMHAGAMAIVGAERLKNLIHIVLDNRAYVSTGDQPSLSPYIDFSKIAEGFRYKTVLAVETKDELRNVAERILKEDGPIFVHIKINRKTPPKGEMKRVSDIYTCPEIKKRFMENF